MGNVQTGKDHGVEKNVGEDIKADKREMVDMLICDKAENCHMKELCGHGYRHNVDRSCTFKCEYSDDCLCITADPGYVKPTNPENKKVK